MVWLLLQYVILCILSQQVLLDPQDSPLYMTVTYLLVTLFLDNQLHRENFKSLELFLTM